MLKNRKILLYAASFIVTGVTFTVTLVALHIYPFGDTAFLCGDMNIQYFDFFKWLKECMRGHDSLIYSFNKSLGGPMYALYAYYLTSPLNLLLYFFNDIQLFITVITVLKISLCSLTVSVYLRNRFSRLNSAYIIMLSLGFALSNYSLLQMANIMWLDGIYMLPLLLLCIYRYIKENKKIQCSLCIGIMIILCWYISYMNCIFAVIYYLYETVIGDYSWNLKKRIQQFFIFCVYEGIGVLVGCIILFPVVIEMLKGKGIQTNNIFVFYKNFALIDLLKGFLYTQSQPISLFCGTFTLIMAVSWFISGRIRIKEKIVSGLLLVFFIVCMQIKALENIWNGFRFAGYYCRFSIFAIFILVICAAGYLEQENRKKDYKVIAVSCSLIIGVYIAVSSALNMKTRILGFSILFVVGYLILYIISMYRFLNSVLFMSLLVVFTMSEIAMQSRIYIKPIYTKNALKYEQYESEQEKLVDNLQKQDDSVYRVDETRHRVDYKTKTTSFLDEGLAYGYKGVAHYSSAFDKDLATFLMKLGYFYTVDMTVYNEPILTSDSLLGLKYLLSETDYDEYNYIMEGYKKDVYENPYALSLGYGVSDKLLEFEDDEEIGVYSPNQWYNFYTRTGNPFEYQNQLFSAILGRDIELYIPVEYQSDIDTNLLTTNIELKQNEKHMLYYGWMDSIERLVTQDVLVDEKKICTYSYWNSFAVFNIGSSKENHTVHFKNYQLQDKEKLQIYALDLEQFREAIDELKKHQANVTQTSHSSMKMAYSAEQDGNLLITIPYDTSWRIAVNGNKVKPQKVCDALMTIPVQAGDNQIILEYRYPYIFIGFAISIVGLLILFAIYWLQRRRNEYEKSFSNYTRI